MESTGAKRMRGWNHILKISMHMKVLVISFLFCGLAGCFLGTNPYAIAYKKNFIGLSRHEALTELLYIQLMVDAQDDMEKTHFQMRCYKPGVEYDPPFGIIFMWSDIYDLQISMPCKCVRELAKEALQNDSNAREAGFWQCFDYTRPNLQLSFSVEKESFGLWFDSNGVVTNQSVIVTEGGP